MNIRNDGRPIGRLVLNNHFYTIGERGVEKIIPYEEYGEMAPVTWYQIWVEGRMEARVNGKYVVAVEYGDFTVDDNVPF